MNWRSAMVWSLVVFRFLLEPVIVSFVWRIAAADIWLALRRAVRTRLATQVAAPLP